MWVKRTDEEIEAARTKVERRAKLGRICAAIAVGLISGWSITFLQGKRGYSSRLMPWSEARQYTPVGLFLGSLVGLFIYCVIPPQPRQKTVICPRCEAAKREDSQPECSCGGHFED